MNLQIVFSFTFLFNVKNPYNPLYTLGWETHIKLSLTKLHSWVLSQYWHFKFDFDRKIKPMLDSNLSDTKNEL